MIQDHGALLPPRQWRSKCGWFFGRGYTEFELLAQPTGHRCRVCFRIGAIPESLRHTSSSTSSSSASPTG